MPDADWILTLNAGSSSLKFALYDMDGARLEARTIAGVEVTKLPSGTLIRALAPIRDGLGLAEAPRGVGHRVVHGLDRHAPCVLDPGSHAEIRRAAVFAPLHNPPALRLINVAEGLFPGVPQVACFDTAFHAANGPLDVTFPLPAAIRETGVRRYGFHGLSYASTVRRFASLTGRPLPRRLLIAHLGAGASMAAVAEGVGVATTMGFSPMDGLVMATRAGATDPGLIFHLMRQGMAADAVERMLNRESGLTGLAGTGDMRALLARDDAEARFAVEHYCRWACRHAGSLIAAMEGVDGMVFTGGVGENTAPVRAKIVEGLAWAGLGAENIWVIPADEEGEIADATLRLIGGAGDCGALSSTVERFER